MPLVEYIFSKLYRGRLSSTIIYEIHLNTTMLGLRVSIVTQMKPVCVSRFNTVDTNDTPQIVTYFSLKLPRTRCFDKCIR